MSRAPGEFHEALMEQMLRETLGGDRPRDMTARVLALAKAHDRRRRNWWISAGSAMAACIAIAITLWMFRPQQYPSPVADGFDVHGELGQPGTQFVAVSNSAGRSSTLNLGGYISVTAAPDTQFTTGGGPRREAVFLESGRIDAVVTKNRGTFDVVVGPAIVEVTGTKFSVDVTKVINDRDAQFEKKMRVAVTEGSVVVRGLGGGPRYVSEGDQPMEFTFPADGISRPRIEKFMEKTEQALTQPAPPAGRGGRGRNAPPPAALEPKFGQLQVIIGPGPFGFDGTLRNLGPYYILQTERGYLLLGTIKDFEPDAHIPDAGTSVHVIFGRGRVSEIRQIEAPHAPLSTPNAPPKTNQSF